MKVCFMGSMEFSVPILERLNDRFDVVMVVTQPDKPFGRKKLLKPTKVKIKAIELGLNIFQPNDIKKNYNLILELDLDYIIVAAYGQMIPEIILAHAKKRAINVHASLLPKYRGGSPMHRAIQYGDTKTGVTIIYMAMKMDAGDVLSQRSIPILENDNVGSLEKKLAILGSDCLMEVLDNIDKITPKKQDINQVTFAYNIKPKEEKISFNMSAKSVYNHVRGFYPWPLTYCQIDGKKIKVYEVKYSNFNLSKNPGEIVKIDNQGVYIQTTDGIVILKNVQLQGKKRMSIRDFMNGSGKRLFQVKKIFE